MSKFSDLFAASISICTEIEECKALFERLYPKRYTIPFGYGDPKYQCMEMAASTVLAGERHAAAYPETLEPFKSEEEHQVFRRSLSDIMTRLIYTDIFEAREAPVYLLASDFGEVLFKATLNDQLLLKDIKLATRAALICLPEDLSRRTFGLHVPYVAYAWADQEYLDGRFQIAAGEFGAGLLSIICYVEIDGVMRCAIQQTSGDLLVNDLLTASENKFENVRNLVVSDPSMTETGFDGLRKKMAEATLKIILGMSALPQLIEGESLQRPAKIKRGVEVRSELWNPKYIGFKYKRVPRPTSTPGNHASPRMHRKDGHWKQQAYGPDRSLRKLIFVDEYWVCVPEEEATAKA